MLMIIKKLFPFLVAVLFLGQSLAQQVTLSHKLKYLRNHVYSVDTCDPEVDDFSDLAFLEEILKDKRIVLLGEHAHSDGKSLMAIIRIIKYLHENLNFNIVLRESDTYALDKFNENLTGNKERDIGFFATINQPKYEGLYYLLSSSRKFVEYLIDQNSKPNPLVIKGIDHYSCWYHRKALKYDLPNFIESFSIDELSSAWAEYRENLDKVYASSGKTGKIKKLKVSTWKLIGILEKSDWADKTDKAIFWINYLKGQIAKFDLIVSFKKKTSEEIANTGIIDNGLRDSVMAQKAQYYIDRIFPEEKIIIWATALHIARNIDSLNIKKGIGEIGDAVPMGHHLWERFGDQIYSIGFTSYEGYRGYHGDLDKEPVEQKSSGSIEYLMKEAGFEYGLLDLSNLDKDGAWLKQENKMSLILNNEEELDWTQVYDGIFFIREMEPDFEKTYWYGEDNAK